MSVKASMISLEKMKEKTYPRLSADERFKMVIKTFVDGDELQREKLVKSCPMFIYSESDHAYTERIEASRDIVTVFIIQLLKYDKIISIMKILNGFNNSGQKFNVDIGIIKEIQAFLSAFETFCEEHLGIASKVMIQAWYGHDEWYIGKVEEFKQMVDFYQIDQNIELKEIWIEKVFLNTWTSRIKS